VIRSGQLTSNELQELEYAKAGLAVRSKLSERDRKILIKTAELVLNSRPQGRPIKNLEKKQLAVLKMQGSWIPEKPPSEEMLDQISTEFHLSLDVVKHLYRNHVFPAHRIRAFVIGAPRKSAERPAIKSRKKKQSDK
jgi:hypothetical protein